MPKAKNIFEIRRIRKIRKSRKPATSSILSKIRRITRQNERAIKYFSIAILTVVASFLVYNYEQYGGYLFKASVLEAPLPFDGTVYPVDKVPNWTHWDGDNHTVLYSQVDNNELIELPAYNLSSLQFASANLIWGNESHDDIRNTKITYPVVYLGNYELDHKEGAGSHLAVDIKMPVGTPVKAIANGRVVKVSNIATGFGHHVVIRHFNVPDPDDSSKKTDLYSAFNHMDAIYVSEGQSVKKGEVIGTSGDTGTSTTPHLHFQIDREEAPWHPYWPFSSAEARAAGLSFFEAVSAGLGLNNARNYTINPMEFVEDNLNYDGVVEELVIEEEKEEVVVVDPEPEKEEEVVVIDPELTEEPEEVVVLDEKEEEESTVDPSLFSFKIVGERTSMVGNGVTITVEDEYSQISQMSDSDTLHIGLTGVGRISKENFKKVDFNNNAIKFIINSSDEGTARIEVGKSSYEVSFISGIKPMNALKIETDGNFQKGQIETIEIIAVDEDGAPTPSVIFGGTIEIKAKQGDAKFTPDRIAVSNFKNGVAEVRMQASNESPIVIRASGGAIVGESDTIYAESGEIFTDVPKAHQNYAAIKYLKDNAIIGGYDDGTFKPGKTVNRAEALKMLMMAFEVASGPGSALPFSDTDNGAWYAGPLSTALSEGIVKGYDDGTFKPGNTVNKAEYLKMLFRTNKIEAEVEINANPYADVPKDAWYAPYAYLTNKKNLLDITGNRLSADQGMTRGDVAETIYRLLYIQDNNLVSYSK